MRASDVAWLIAALVVAGCSNEPQYPNCRGDQQCQSQGHHGYCIRGTCQQCRADTDCPSGQMCQDDRCEQRPIAAAAQCDESHACPSGQDCVAGHCLAANPSTVAAYSSDGGGCSFPSIHFAFDDAVLDEQARHGLQETSDCLHRERTTHYVLVGRADPRGTAEYNVALGARRARSVQHYLTSLGTDEGRLAVTSAGSEGASGGDESSYAQDRRVDSTRR